MAGRRPASSRTIWNVSWRDDRRAGPAPRRGQGGRVRGAGAGDGAAGGDQVGAAAPRGAAAREPQPGRRPGDLPGDGGAGLHTADRGGMADRGDGFGHAGGGPAGRRVRGGPRRGPLADGGAARGRPAPGTAGPQFIPPNGLGYQRPPRPVRRALRGPGLCRARRPAGAARRGGRLRDPGAGRPGGRRRGGDHGRVHAGPGAAGAGTAPARGADGGHRGPRVGQAPRRAARGRAGHRTVIPGPSSATCWKAR